jgi:hypothetical protein
MFDHIHTLDFSSIPLIPDASWPEKESDIKAAIKIIKEHIDAGGPIKLIDSYEEKEGTLTVVMPKWLGALSEHFDPLYGEQAAELIFQITCIIFHETFGPMEEEMKHKGEFIRQQN